MTSTLPQAQYAEVPDLLLVTHAKNGNSEAVDELVRRHWRGAYKVAVHILRRHEDAEDVAQDTLFSAVRHLAEFREEASFTTWLHRMAVNRSLEMLRKKRSSPLATATEMADDRPPRMSGGPPSPEQIALQAERNALVEHALTRVPALYSVALRLSALEERPTAEIACRLALSRNALKTRLHRGRAYLRTQLERRLRPVSRSPVYN